MSIIYKADGTIDRAKLPDSILEAIGAVEASGGSVDDRTIEIMSMPISADEKVERAIQEGLTVSTWKR